MTTTKSAATTPARNSRIAAIDLARGIALVAMAIYHFAWDLEFFGYATPGMTSVGGWKIFARVIASSFLVLVGVSLLLAHGERIRWRGFWRRLAMVAAAAAAITVATWFATPGSFIFMGILHQIALASVVGLLFLRLPAWLVLAVAAFMVAAPLFLTSSLFDGPALWWLGLAEARPRSNDYVPMLPWTGAVLAGIAAAKIARASGLLDRLARLRPGRWSAPLVFAGRHSLAVYLLHQPVLIAALWAFSQVMPPAAETSEVRFMQACHSGCENQRDAEFCTRYCACMLEEVAGADMLDAASGSGASEAEVARITGMAEACTAAADGFGTEGAP